MNVRDIPRTMRTVRHLNWSQPMWRLVREGQRRLEPFVATSPRGVTPARVERVSALRTLPPPPRPASPLTTLDLLQGGRFRHLHQTCHVGRARPEWRLGTQRRDRLWSVTLHYHRWLYELACLASETGETATRAQSILTDYWFDWIERCDLKWPAARPLAWNAYAIATRIGWWVQAIRRLGRPFFERHLDLWKAVVTSMWRQAIFLAGHLEWDLRGNHLIRDAVGLAWVARFFGTADRSMNRRNRIHVPQGSSAMGNGRSERSSDQSSPGPVPRQYLRIDRAHDRQASRWLAAARRIAADQADEQILADGCHFERSPMYHLEVMEDLATLAALLGNGATVGRLRQTVRRMADSAAWLAHPDGELVQFNDGERRNVRQAVAALVRLGHGHLMVPQPRGGRHFEETGWVIWHDARWSIFFDVGPLGPACQPGHGHADTLTIDASCHGHRLFVDPGSHGYDHDDRRRYDRSTAAHNSVCIDDTDSSEMWHIFRVGRRANPLGVYVTIGDEGLTAEAAHDGYRHLPGQPCHHRRVAVRRGGHLEVIDRVDGTGQHVVQGGWLLDPHWRAEPTDGGWWLHRFATRVHVRIDSPSSLSLAIEPAWIHPYYGVEQQTDRLVWRYEGVIPIMVRTVMDTT